MAGMPASRTDNAAAQKALLVAGASSAAVVGAAVSGSLATATYFARKVLTPDQRRPDDTRILAVSVTEVTLAESAETVVPGRYGLWFDGGAGHARVGDILRHDVDAGTVVRRIIARDRGPLAPGPARWNQYFYWDDPHTSLGLPFRPVAVDGELGPMPAWILEPEHPTGRWAVLVHGRAARREECLRAVPPLLRLGYTCLVVTYRNDPGAPPAPDGRYNLGLSEWRDVESALEYALAAGADSVVLGGWSMGGAVILQTLKQTALDGFVDAVFLDSPVVDWRNVLVHHARLHHVPPPLRDLGTLVMGRRATRRLVGVHHPVDVALTDWVARASEIRHRILIQHSVDDEFVPAGPSIALAEARPDLVTWERWDTARHCKEWNLDSPRWERVLSRFLQP